MSAHDEHSLAAEALRRWTWEPFTLALLALSSLSYVRCASASGRARASGRGDRAWQAAAFAPGLLSLAVALVSPVAWLSEILFSVHMTQHEMLMLVSAPLLVFRSSPAGAVVGATAADASGMGPLDPSQPVAAAWHALTGPLAVFLIHALAIWIVAHPALYEAALHNDGIHALEH